MAKQHDAGVDHGEHSGDVGSSKATLDEPYPKVKGLNKPSDGHAGSHDSVAREHGRELNGKGKSPQWGGK